MHFPQIKQIVESAIAAPSGDNCQPITYEWEPPILRLCNNEARGAAKINVANIATFIHIGAALVNIELQAKNIGYEARWKYFDKNSERDFHVEVSFTPCQANSEPLLDCIPLRHTNRNPYITDPVSESALASIRSKALELEESGLEILPYSKQMKEAAKTLAQFDRMIFEDEGCHQALFEWIRWGTNKTYKFEDGMPIASLELTPWEKLSFWFMRSWKFTKLMSALQFGTVSSIRAYNLYKRSGAIGLIYVGEIKPDNLINAGRKFQTVWLSTTYHGLQFQPAAGAALFISKVKLDGGVGVLPKHLTLLNKVASKVREQFPSSKQKYPVIAFRIGQAKRVATARTSRFPVEKVLKDLSKEAE